jgi:NAD(P)-dependent dehydrogenase (short-subunit alcohol dehydrogenase family)
MCRAALPHLLTARGNIVNVASTAALAGLPYGVAYGASKGGVLALTRALAVEYGKQGVRCNAVCPGSIQTPMTSGGAGLPADADMKLVMRQMALDRPRGPEQVASLIAFLASSEAAHINGSHILVDGGTLA